MIDPTSVFVAFLMLCDPKDQHAGAGLCHVEIAQFDTVKECESQVLAVLNRTRSNPQYQQDAENGKRIYGGCMKINAAKEFRK